MRTNIEIDDDMIPAAMQVSGLKTKRATVEEGLRTLIRLKRQADVRTLFGRVCWQGDLDVSRLGFSRKQLSDIVNGHAGISPEMAIRLEKAFGGGAET